jgi:hypothetical protein
MKKLLSLTLLFVGLSAFGQDFKTYSFLNVRSIVPSNGLSFTNIDLLNGVTTNVYSVHYTNLAGSQVVPNGTTNNSENVFKPVPLWADREGRWYGPTFAVSSGTNDTVQSFSPSYCNINVRLVGGSGANSAVQFVFAPIWDDSGTIGTESGDNFTFTVTATTTTIINMATNVPVYKWIGAKGLAVRSVTNPDGDASSQVVITELNLNGFQP